MQDGKTGFAQVRIVGVEAARAARLRTVSLDTRQMGVERRNW